MSYEFSTAFIKQALAKHLKEQPKELPTAVSGFSTDTRTIKPGELFISLQGENFDGHHFLEQALQKGASALLVHNTDNLPANAPAFIVDDTLKALHSIARTHLQKMPAKRVGLTGSNGKTTTKELIRHALQQCYGAQHVFASKANFNNHIGVPMNALNVRPEHKVAVFEMGMNHLGEITELCHITMPQVALVTNMGSAHAGNVGGPDGVAKAKAEIFEALKSDGVAVVNADDPRCVREASLKVKGPQVTFGKAKWASVRVLNVQNAKREEASGEQLGLQVIIGYQGTEYPLWLPLLGEHNAVNAAAALAVAVALKQDVAVAVQGISQMKAVENRLNKHVLSNGAIMIDDTYNANPESMEAGLSILTLWPNRRHVAVLGGMVELGQDSVGLHRNVGAMCAQKGIKRLYACGENAQHYGEGAYGAGLPSGAFTWVPTSEELAIIVAHDMQSNDILFVKGSHAMKMEKIVQYLLNQ